MITNKNYNFRLCKMERIINDTLTPVLGYVTKTEFSGYSISIMLWNFQEREQSRTDKHEKDSFLSEQSAVDYVNKYIREHCDNRQQKNFILYTAGWEDLED